LGRNDKPNQAAVTALIQTPLTDLGTANETELGRRDSTAAFQSGFLVAQESERITNAGSDLKALNKMRANIKRELSCLIKHQIKMVANTKNGHGCKHDFLQTLCVKGWRAK